MRKAENGEHVEHDEHDMPAEVPGGVPDTDAAVDVPDVGATEPAASEPVEQAGAPVELDGAPVEADVESPVAAAQQLRDAVEAAPAAPAAAPRGRRKRGRVVAPAGPPRPVQDATTPEEQPAS
jgi:ribonuclease E